MTQQHFDAVLSTRPMRAPLRYGKRHLQLQVRGDLIKSAFTEFSDAAQVFAASLSDEMHRNFALRYFNYLQHIAHGKTLAAQPNGFGLGPACRLIRAELDRLFDLSFLSTNTKVAA